VGEGEGKFGPAAHFALYADFPALRLDEVFDDRQAESSAAEFARTGLIDAIETLKQTGEIFRRDADAGILDEDFGERKGGEIAHADDDGAVFGGVFQGVIDEIRQNLIDGFGVAKRFRLPLRGLEAHGEILALGQREHGIERILHERVDVVGRELELLLLHFDARKGEQVGGEVAEAFGVLANDAEEADVVLGFVDRPIEACGVRGRR
jgi:hypothetical protein